MLSIAPVLPDRRRESRGEDSGGLFNRARRIVGINISAVPATSER